MILTLILMKTRSMIPITMMSLLMVLILKKTLIMSPITTNLSRILTTTKTSIMIPITMVKNPSMIQIITTNQLRILTEKSSIMIPITMMILTLILMEILPIISIILWMTMNLQIITIYLNLHIFHLVNIITTSPIK